MTVLVDLGGEVEVRKDDAGQCDPHVKEDAVHLLVFVGLKGFLLCLIKRVLSNFFILSLHFSGYLIFT